MTDSPAAPAAATSARNAVALVFALNGFCFATLASRVPDLRESLHLSNGALGALLLSVAVGSMLGMPASGHLIERWGAGAVVRLGALADLVGLVLAGAMATAGSAPGAAVGLLAYGFGTGVWDVAMNVDGAAVERELGRSIMPRFHAGLVVRDVHRRRGRGCSRRSRRTAGRCTTPSSPPSPSPSRSWPVAGCSPSVEAENDAGEVASRSAWLEPRTLAIGFMVLAFTLAEGSANDWLALGLIDGYDARHWVGVLGFALFVASMTLGRLGGPLVLDRFGRAPSMLASALAATIGVLIVVWRRSRGAGRARHRALGLRSGPGLPGRDERRRRRPGPCRTAR